MVPKKIPIKHKEDSTGEESNKEKAWHVENKKKMADISPSLCIITLNVNG